VSTAAGATGAPSSPGAAHSAAGFDGVPVYQPSRTIKRSSGSLLLASPNSYADVSSYYATTLANQGWVIVSKESLPQGEIITVKRGTVVASVLLAPKGTGASIDIAAYSTR
jgi:hypothetical protein